MIVVLKVQGFWCINHHRTNKHGFKQQEESAPATYQSTSMQQNQVGGCTLTNTNQEGGSDLTNSNQEQGYQSVQQRVPIEYYQNIKNRLDQARIYLIQWQEANKKLYEDANELEGHLNKEVDLNHNLHTQLQTLQDVNKRWEQAYHTLQSRSNY